MGGKRQTLLRKTNENREGSFRPRLWGNKGNPMTKDMLDTAIRNADLAEEYPKVEEVIDPEDVPPGTVILTEKEESEMMGEETH